MTGWTSAILITAMDIYGLPDSLKAPGGSSRRIIRGYLEDERNRPMYEKILVTLDGTSRDRRLSNT